MSEVEITSLHKSFGTVSALDHVSLTIADGELVSLLGPSGCGKTTLLRCIAGLVTADGGAIRFGGRDVTEEPARDRGVGMVFQHYALFPNLTAAGNIAFPLEARGWQAEDVRKRVAELLDVVGLASASQRYPHQLSGGQQQRVALARALAPRPRVLLLDEPLSALDAPIRNALRDQIREIQLSLGMTAVYVTHDQAEALAVADRIGVMENGRLVELGTPSEIYRSPSSRFGAGFVGGRNAVPLKVDANGQLRWKDAFSVAASGFASGAPVIATFPPESVMLVDEQGISGKIVFVSFRGAMTRFRLATAEGEIDADVPSLSAPSLGRGDMVRFKVHADIVRLYPGSDAAGVLP